MMLFLNESSEPDSKVHFDKLAILNEQFALNDSINHLPFGGFVIFIVNFVNGDKFTKEIKTPPFIINRLLLFYNLTTE